MCQKYCCNCGEIFPSYNIEGNSCPNCGQPRITDKKTRSRNGNRNGKKDVKHDKHTKRLKR